MMGAYRRILSIVEISADAAPVIRRGQQMAEFYGASLAVAGWIGPAVDASATTIRQRLSQISDATAALEDLVARAGAKRADVFVAERSCAVAMRNLIGTWQPDLVVIATAGDGRGNLERHGLVANGEPSFDVLTIRPERRGLACCVREALAGVLGPIARAASGVG